MKPNMCSVLVKLWEDKLGPHFFFVELMITMYIKVKVCNMDRHRYNQAFVGIATIRVQKHLHLGPKMKYDREYSHVP